MTEPLAPARSEIEQKICDVETLVLIVGAVALNQPKVMLQVLLSDRVREFAEREAGTNVLADFAAALIKEMG